jgi:hypothetical protein
VPDPTDPTNPSHPDSPAPSPQAREPSAAGESSTSLTPPEREVEGAVPPGYDWPTHGGYLGCLVGTLAACPIVGFIGANIWALLRLSWLEFPLFVLLMLASIVVVLAAGRLGWALGKRFYRYYPQQRPTWGESDQVPKEGGTPDGAAPEEAQPSPSSEASDQLADELDPRPPEESGV